MLVAFSHLRWGFVWQRPQHLLSRFAREMPIVFVEEPEWGFAKDEVRIRRDGNVTVVTPLIAGPVITHGFGTHVNQNVSRLIEPLIAPDPAPIFWYYTPMALGAEPVRILPGLTVYDAMDDLASFLAAPPELRDKERRMLAQVDLVFTGGPTLYRQRRDRHPAVHCFPSGVDGAHFAPRMSMTPVGLEGHRRPILGYYGVIDERLDLPLVAALAGARPEWTIALVGPVAKIDERAIPARDNIVRFGQQAYRDLPSFLAAFDIALMPFARNYATRAISPTKTLEYLAGGKPVISTPIADVIDLYGDVVEIAATAAEFIAAAKSLLTRTGEEDRQWRTRAARLLVANDWEAIAAEMLDVMARARATTLVPAADRGAVALTA
ncbi:MAG: glycosyltransferase [Chloroflexia bacterium]|nr:glycosyltransferase [Chloroflexia bacterium]